MKTTRKPNYKYPAQPTTHIINGRHKRRRTNVGADYKFLNRGVFFRLAAAFMRSVVWFFFPIWSLAHGTRIKGRRHFKAVRGQGAVLVSNHVHPTDAFTIGACLSRRRKVRIVILKDNIDLPITGKIIRLLGGIPLSDNFGGQKSFTRAIDTLLEKKKPVLFFPEAALWPHYTALRPFNAGGFRFAAKHNVPILPMVFTFKINRKGKKGRHTLTVLPPVYPDGRNPRQLSAHIYNQMLSATSGFYSNPRHNKSGKMVELTFEPSESPDSQNSIDQQKKADLPA